jgi:hypothetical protein
MRVENLEDGYHVSGTLCFDDIDSCYVGTQCLEELVFTPTIKDVLTKYMDGMMSVLFSLQKIFENLTRHAAQHAPSMTIWQ